MESPASRSSDLPAILFDHFARLRLGSAKMATKCFAPLARTMSSRNQAVEMASMGGLAAFKLTEPT